VSEEQNLYRMMRVSKMGTMVRGGGSIAGADGFSWEKKGGAPFCWRRQVGSH